VGAAAAAHAALPVGWNVETFTGRILEIETAGGVVACATDGGLLLFDPATTRFAPAVADAGCTDRNCLPSNQLTSVSRDASGQYWLGTRSAGVVAYAPQTIGRQFTRFFALNTAPGGDLLGDSVTCVEAFLDERIYVGTTRGVAQIDRVGDVESHNVEAARLLGTHVRGSIVHDLAVDANFVWVATDSGMSRYDRRPPYTVQVVSDSLGTRPAYTVEILSGVVHAGTRSGVYTWDESALRWRRLGPATPEFKVNSVSRISGNRYFAGSDAEVWYYNGFVWGRLSPPGLPRLGSRVFPTVAASGDTIWTSQSNSDGKGAFLNRWHRPDPMMPAGRWDRFEANSLPVSAVQAVSVGPASEVWVGTDIGGVGRLDVGGTWCIYSGNTVGSNLSDPDGHVSALLVDRGGQVWIHALPNTLLRAPVDVLTPGALCDHGEDAWAHYAPDDAGFGGRYWGTALDGVGRRYLLSDGEQETAAVANGIEVISADGTRVGNIRAAVLGGNGIGALAFATTSGAWSQAYVGINNLGTNGLKRWTLSEEEDIYTPGTANFTSLALPASMSVSEYRDIVVVPGANLLWVATGAGIFEYDLLRGQVRRTLGKKFDAKPGLLSPDVRDLELDDAGNLWIATTHGLNRIVVAGLDAGETVVVNSFTTIEAIRELNASSSFGQLYDARRDLAPLPTADTQALAYDAARKRLHVGTAGGLASIDVLEFQRRPTIQVSDAVLYPNPVRIDAGHEEVRIARLGEPAVVTILTLEGEEVCRIDVEDGDVVWDLRVPSCLGGTFRATSGTYLVRIATATASVVRPLVVIR
jgi:ligand-binding sensor domain-containing protein